MDLSIGIITAPRPAPTLELTIAELRHAGFDQPLHIFAEPGSAIDDWPNVVVTRNEQTLGLWPNWLQAATTLLSTTDSRFLMICEDDLLLARGAAAALQAATESIAADSWGIASLYTPRHNVLKTEIRNGWNALPLTSMLWGALAYCFSRESLIDVLHSRPVLLHHGGEDTDSVVPRALHAAGRGFYSHVPSLCAHNGGHNSTVGHVALGGMEAVGFDPLYNGSPRIGSQTFQRDRSDRTARFNPVNRRESAATTDGTAVCVISHNYGRYLSEALDSVLGQSRPASEVLVVDDASVDETPRVADRYAERGVRYLRVEEGNVHRARGAGLRHTRSPLLCFLDADDVLPPDYLERGVPLFAQPNVGIVFSDVETFGEDHRRIEYPPFPGCSLQQRNFAHAGSLVRRTALETAGVFESPLPAVALDDWFVWKPIEATGWRLAKNPARYRYRRHSESKSTFLIREQTTYYDLAALHLEPVTLAVPLSGRSAVWPRFREFLETQTWPHRQTRLLLLDTSQNESFTRIVRNWLADSDYPQVQYLTLAVGRAGLADEDRRDGAVCRRVQQAMPLIYNRIKRECCTEFLWIVEDDVIPPLDVCERLLRSFDAETATVAAPYKSRFHPGYVAWHADGNPITRTGSGVAVVAGNGFGCVILRKSVLDEFVFHHGGRGDFDPNFYAELSRTRFRAKLDWGCECDHVG